MSLKSKLVSSHGGRNEIGLWGNNAKYDPQKSVKGKGRKTSGGGLSHLRVRERDGLRWSRKTLQDAESYAETGMRQSARGVVAERHWELMSKAFGTRVNPSP